MSDGREEHTGRFGKGNTFGKGRPKGSRNKLTSQMLDRFAERNANEAECVENVLFDIMSSAKSSDDLKFKAAKQLSDMVFPKAQSVQLEIENNDGLTLEQMDKRILELMGNNEEVEDVQQDDADQEA